MNVKNTMLLLERFPKLFRPDPELKQNLMAFGFECGNGWNSILWKLCLDLSFMLKKMKGRKPDPEYSDFQVMQVKEKLGTLRFYVNWATDQMYDRIRQAEEESARTCEVCGLPGKLRDDGWLQTLCDECWEKNK